MVRAASRPPVPRALVAMKLRRENDFFMILMHWFLIVRSNKVTKVVNEEQIKILLVHQSPYALAKPDGKSRAL